MKKREGLLLDVRGALSSGAGSQTKFKLNQKLKSDEIKTIQPITGLVILTKINNHLLTNFKIKTQLNLNCDRCLKPFNKKIQLNFERIYTKNPKEPDQLPINPNLTIEIGESLIEELILTQSIKNLCQIKCKGLKNYGRT